MPTELISAHTCGSHRVAIAYHEIAYAHFSSDGQDREDGFDVEECELQFDHIYCIGCGQKRTITSRDEEILNGIDGETESGKDEEGQ